MITLDVYRMDLPVSLSFLHLAVIRVLLNMFTSSLKEDALLLSLMIAQSEYKHWKRFQMTQIEN